MALQPLSQESYRCSGRKRYHRIGICQVLSRFLAYSALGLVGRILRHKIPDFMS
jgi:hypothetical protein